MRERSGGWIGGKLGRDGERDNRVHEQNQINENRQQFDERQGRVAHEAHCYHCVRELLHDLKVDLSRMATAEEKNGNYKTADSLTAIRIRLAEEFDVLNVARLARDRAEYHGRTKQ